MLQDVRAAEAAGLGSVWISERHDVKESAVLSGAAAAATDTLAIAVGVTNPNTRHLMVTAAIGSTMHALSGGRFALGLGRGFDIRSDMWGAPRVTGAMLADTAQLLRRLWAGEKIIGHDGPAGRFPYLSLDYVAAPAAAAGAGGARPADAGVGRARVRCRAVALALDRPGRRRLRDPRARAAPSAPAATRTRVQVWSCLVTACDLPEPVELRHVVRRMTTYMQIPGYGELIVDANGWDRAVLDRVRTHPLLQGRLADATEFTDDELRTIRDVYPPHWLSQSNAVGSAAHCARRIVDQFDAGAAGVILHASAPARWQRCSTPTPRCGRPHALRGGPPFRDGTESCGQECRRRIPVRPE